MARPKKIGLDYFPLDVNPDDQFKAIEELHGNDGFTWIVKFWQAAYRTNDGIVDLNGIRGVLAAKTSRISSEKQAEIIRDCIDLHLLYEVEPGKYTSNGIQKRLLKIRQDRENDRNYARNKLSERKLSDNLPIMQESKEKEKKRKKEREEHTPTSCMRNGKRVEAVKHGSYVLLTGDEYDRMLEDWGEKFTKKAIAEYDRRFPNSKAIRDHTDHNRAIRDYVNRGYLCQGVLPEPYRETGPPPKPPQEEIGDPEERVELVRNNLPAALRNKVGMQLAREVVTEVVGEIE